MIFLHEGLGSIELWRTFPNNVVRATSARGVVYSREGNGWSDPLDDDRGIDYMHDEATRVLPELAGIFAPEPPILIGHSDGASIALMFAGSGHPVTGLVLIAPHVFVESVTLNSIGALRQEFPGSEMAQKMAKYHADPERTFYGWADIWLADAFASWNIEEFLPAISCPTLTIQGDADEYGTLAQLEAIDAGIDHPMHRLVVEGAGHAPHISHPTLVTDAVIDFIRRIEP